MVRKFATWLITSAQMSAINQHDSDQPKLTYVGPVVKSGFLTHIFILILSKLHFTLKRDVLVL